MKYIDSGIRDSGNSFGGWLRSALGRDVRSVRLQSGYFSEDAAGFLGRLDDGRGLRDRDVRAVIGANGVSTSGKDVEALAAAIGLPRKNALLGLVKYDDRRLLYHPKTIHLCRADGSEAAYVGSSNLTRFGLAHSVEAGVILDTAEGDNAEVLSAIASAVDAWFVGKPRPGFHRVKDSAEVASLVSRRIVATAEEARRARRESRGRAGKRPAGLAALAPLLDLIGVAIPDPISEAQSEAQGMRPVEPRVGYRADLHFAPGLQTPTQGAAAMTGRPLPGGAVGIIFKLNKDATRWRTPAGEKKEGTANISVPFDVAPTLRFGLNDKSRTLPPKPRMETRVRCMYITVDSALTVDAFTTNIMAYGAHELDAKSHPNLRMVLTAAPQRRLAELAQSSGNAPRENDLAALEWPQDDGDPEFRLSFAERGTKAQDTWRKLFDRRQRDGTQLGRGACLLPDDARPTRLT